MLWRPEGQRWALGVDAYEVWQRGFDRLFDLQKYHVFTGMCRSITRPPGTS